MLPRKDLDKAKQVGKEMTELTGLYIEDNIYTKVVIRDVNSYVSVYEDGSLKLKGAFEIDKEFHKDPSMRIVPIAVKEYFINGIPIEETIRNHTDIYDFCLRLKTNSKSTPKYVYLDGSEVKEKTLQRTTRYYISNKGGILQKDFGNENPVGVNVGFQATIFNKYVKKDMKDYDINYNFYEIEARKLIRSVEGDGQLSLF